MLGRASALGEVAKDAMSVQVLKSLPNANRGVQESKGDMQ